MCLIIMDEDAMKYEVFDEVNRVRTDQIFVVQYYMYVYQLQGCRITAA